MRKSTLPLLILMAIGLSAVAQKKNNKTEVFKVYGTCEQCKHRIETALNNYGVYKANWDIESKMLTVSYDSTRFSKTGIEQRIAAAGHDTEEYQADESTYQSLPKCCYYDRYKKPGPMAPGDSSIVHSSDLQQVVVTYRAPSAYVSSLSTMNTSNLGSRELAKAACCNLSESFETSPSVDVSYSDAVTGIKQIQLLGLSGNYTQITTENTPELRGLAGSYGMTFIPGPWIEGIQVTKGVGSVANGYESIAGQINIEEKKPDKADKLFVNGYANNMGREEATVELAKKLNEKWSTALFTHANGVFNKIDKNGDGFLDIPLGGQVNILNRWRYSDTRGLFAQVTLKALTDHRQAGQDDFYPATDKYTTNHYGVGIDVQQYGVSGKLGYVFPQEVYKSIGLIFSAIDYTNHSYYGLNRYDGRQNSVYANLIYQSIIGSTINKFRAGISFVSDHFKETYIAKDFERREVVPGAFFEYTYTPGKKFSAIAGFRLDHHNEYGFIPTPRLHLKYDLTPGTNLRLSVGSGFRLANIFAENTGLLVSSRQVDILDQGAHYGYGLGPEKAWNYGLDLVHQFTFHERKGSITVDAYRTNFTRQVVVDVDADPQQIRFYNLQGRSYSNSLQAEIDYELIRRLDVRVAYRWLDVKTDYGGQMLQKPMIAKGRAFINLAYESGEPDPGRHWKFDLTTQWIGSKRLPNTSGNPPKYQVGNTSPAYIQLSAQVTRELAKKWDVYIGGENLTGYTQKNLFIAGDQPFSPYFDGSMVWGPVNGRVGYMGLRYRIH